ncbi:hypothetical protein LTS18_007998 [Coniosporium uncinatum]|uniref:Uncharacterized protein n=1 Tax=Coniosporium uncinatum TaxID=93489 RepID=A0ACC3D2H6_9PEZI|nr:hypothetical protein LTS18_007998 [Coniosporium uncinatum]
MTSDSSNPRKPTPPTNPNGIAQPSRTLFDPWNSSGTGHQRADNRLSGSTSWRDSRNFKLSNQYRAGHGGGSRHADLVGAGSSSFGEDGRKENGGWIAGASGLRTGGQKSIQQAFSKSKDDDTIPPSAQERDPPPDDDDEDDDEDENQQPVIEEDADAVPPPNDKKQLFSGLTFYINGSTSPLISDHKLKHLLAQHGGRLSMALGRRSVTHVILGTTAGSGGAGGGLAGSKIQKEVARTRGKAVKFVGAEWVVESVRAGQRLPEARFAELKLAANGQRSVMGMFRPTKPGLERKSDGKG